MRTKMSSRTVRGFTAWGTAVFLALGVGCTGGGDTVISGLGNSGNNIGAAALWSLLANTLAEHEATPTVRNEEIASVYEAIRQNALRGELESALVLLKLAADQRDE